LEHDADVAPQVGDARPLELVDADPVDDDLALRRQLLAWPTKKTKLPFSMSRSTPSRALVPLG
jgi:hypothetical protein